MWIKHIITKIGNDKRKKIKIDSLERFIFLYILSFLDLVYMQDVTNDIKVIEEDLENVIKKCEKENSGALYDVIVATNKLIYDLLFCCCKKKH